jgi:hypothetical protein
MSPLENTDSPASNANGGRRNRVPISAEGSGPQYDRYHQEQLARSTGVEFPGRLIGLMCAASDPAVAAGLLAEWRWIDGGSDQSPFALWVRKRHSPSNVLFYCMEAVTEATLTLIIYGVSLWGTA